MTEKLLSRINPGVSSDVFNTLKELQLEKKRLEQKLQDVKLKRQKQERVNQTVLSKHMQVKDVHTKMNETLKVAQQKVALTQSLVEKLTEENSNHRIRITALQNKVENEEIQQSEQRKKFEEILSDLSDKMVDAGRFYTKDNLMKEIQNSEDSKKDYLSKTQEVSKQLNKISEKLQDLQLDEKCVSAGMAGITIEEQRVVYQMIKEEKMKNMGELEQITKSVDALNEQLKKIESETNN